MHVYVGYVAAHACVYVGVQNKRLVASMYACMYACVWAVRGWLITVHILCLSVCACVYVCGCRKNWISHTCMCVCYVHVCVFVRIQVHIFAYTHVPFSFRLSLSALMVCMADYNKALQGSCMCVP